MRAFFQLFVVGAWLMFSGCQPAWAKPGKKPQPSLPPNARFTYPSGKEFCSGTPYKDGILTVSHANLAPGAPGSVTENSVTIAFKVTAVTRITVPGISKGEGLENRGGDLVFLAIDPKLPYWMTRAEIDPKLVDAAALKVTAKDGRRVSGSALSLAYRKQASAGMYPDGLNPRWMLFTAKLDPGGNSGGGIYRGKYLTGVVSRLNASPALGHKDVRGAIIRQTQAP